MPKPSGNVKFKPPESITDILGLTPEQQAFWDRARAFQASQDYSGFDDTGAGVDTYLRKEEIRRRKEEMRQQLMSYLQPYLEMTGLYQNTMAPPPQNMMRGIFGLRQRGQ
jgi:hypothetical protein